MSELFKEEKQPEIRFENNWPIEEVAALVSEVRNQEADYWKSRGKKETIRQRYTPEEAEERLRKLLENPNAIELILTVDGELAGCGFAIEQPEEELKEELKELPKVNLFSTGKERVFSIKEVDLKSKHRGIGLGRMMMEEIMRQASESGATTLLLSTPPDKDFTALNLYERLGFKEIASMKEQVAKKMYYMSKKL